MKPKRILVIDDEGVIGDACRVVLSEKGHQVVHCLTGMDGLKAIRTGSFDVILLDMKLADIDGMEILQDLQKKQPHPCVIVMTGYATISNAVEAMKLGAADYLAKPFTDDELISTVEIVCMQRQQGKLT